MTPTSLPSAARGFTFSVFHYWVFGFLFSISCHLASAAEPAKKFFDLPAGAAEQSLKQFAVQSGLEVLFVSESVANVRTKAVKGDYTPKEAIALMLADTHLNHAKPCYRTREFRTHLAAQRLQVDSHDIRRFCKKHGIARDSRAGRPRKT